MLAPHIKRTVDKLWDRFWSAGLTNPIVAIEQITYLLFLKRLEDIDAARVEQNQTSIYDASRYENAPLCKWSEIQKRKDQPQHLIDVVFPWLRQLENYLSEDSKKNTELASLNNRMSDAYFQLDANKTQVLADAIVLIDQLFARTGKGSAAQDVMGDTFEYLLSEMATAGKNGQFRTPRHIIRFMVELLDPQPGERIIDPAAGTGGFLFSAQQYLLRKATDESKIRLEWDGAIHRTDGKKLQAEDPEKFAAISDGSNFVGLDNDRTMARIGWMNLILHELKNPQIVQGDSLSRRDKKPQIAQLLEPESYDYVLANPPFTGTVDSSDLEPDPLLFPQEPKKIKRVPKNAKEPSESLTANSANQDSETSSKAPDVITNKSELLFCWLMLDLLKVGGRCAVILPEGVLFGNSDAHIRLRRELLTQHEVEAVISGSGLI